MATDENKTIAKKWFEAFNAHNLNALLSLYHIDAQHFSPKLKIRFPQTNGLISSRQALSDWWQDAFTRLPTLHYRPIKIMADDEQVFMEYTRRVEDEEDLRVGEVLQIENGLIVFSRVYHG